MRNQAEQDRFDTEIKARRLTENIQKAYIERVDEIRKCLTEARSALELVVPDMTREDDAKLDGEGKEQTINDLADLVSANVQKT